MSQQKLVQIRGIPVYPSLPPWLAFTGGNIWHVKPYSGNDGNPGDRPDRAWKTLGKVISSSEVVAGRNDVVLLHSESNTASATTDYQGSTLDWSKDMTHLIGVNSGSVYSQRSRVAFSSTYDTASNLFTLSADGCYIANVQFYAGVAGTNPTGCFQVTGDRNRLDQCHISGIGNDANDIANAYSLYLNGVEELYVKNCRIGLNTTAAGTAANFEIWMANTVKNVEFEDCLIYRRIEHDTNHPLVKVAAATSLDEINSFTRCKFISTSTNYANSNAGVFKFAANPTQGLIVLDQCSAWNGTTAGKWDVDDLDNLLIMNNPTPAADTCGIYRAV